MLVLRGGLRRAVALFAVGVCSAAGVFIVDAAPAVAEAEIIHRPEGVKATELIADNWAGSIEHEVEYREPAGNYYYTIGLGPGGDGTYEYTDECEEGNLFENCKGLHTVINQNTEAPLPKGYLKFEHQGIDSLYHGKHTATYSRYAWAPAEKESELYGSENGVNRTDAVATPANRSTAPPATRRRRRPISRLAGAGRHSP